ncbi:MAG: putative manganese transporter [Candidatus Paceibacterota bacterium]
MLNIFLDSFLDASKMVPFLLFIYIAIEIAEYKFGDKIRSSVEKAGKSGPFLGALAGSFPQCGFSVVTTALYSQRLVTIGTLLAVYLSTSDEAIPIILSNPGAAGLVIPLIFTKILIAIVAGYYIDLFFRKSNAVTLAHIDAYSHGADDKNHHHESVVDEHACCGHNISQSSKTFNIKEIFFHPLKHTLKIFSFIFIVSFLINFIFFKVGTDKIESIFASFTFLQPFLAGLIGLIPNCASSVALTELYLKGVITYGSLIAGLCAGGGLGVLVLFREEKNKKEVFKIIGLLFGISVFVGLVIQYLF